MPNFPPRKRGVEISFAAGAKARIDSGRGRREKLDGNDRRETTTMDAVLDEAAGKRARGLDRAFEILDFLQRFMTDFENRYARQINRHYKQRSRPKAITRPPAVAPQDEPF